MTDETPPVPFMDLTELYLRQLISEAQSDTPKSNGGGVYADAKDSDPERQCDPLPSIAFKDRIHLCETATRFLAIKHRIKPEEEAPDGITSLRDQLSRGKAGGGGIAAARTSAGSPRAAPVSGSATESSATVTPIGSAHRS